MSGVALAGGSKQAMDEEEVATVGGFGQFYKVRSGAGCNFEAARRCDARAARGV